MSSLTLRSFPRFVCLAALLFLQLAFSEADLQAAGARLFKSGPIQITADGRWVWVANADNDSVTRINTTNDAVIEFVLPDPGTKDSPRGLSVKGDKNTQSLAKVEELIAHYQPGVMVLQDTSTRHSRRSPRIRALSQKIIAVAATRKVSVALFSQEQVRRVFFADGQGTKHALAEILAQRFPEEPSSRLPPKRRPWMSEDSRMDIFDAVALVLVLRLKKAKRTA